MLPCVTGERRSPTSGVSVSVSRRRLPPLITRHGVRVEAETAGVRDVVDEIAALVIRGGGYLHPELTVRERDGHVTLSVDRRGADEVFIRLPRDVLVPVTALSWDEEADHMSLVSGRSSLTPLQGALVDLHIALWNLTGKLAHFRARHPKSAAVEDADLEAAVRLLRPTFHRDQSPAGMVHTRTFGMPRADGRGQTSVIMPILELADHHTQGAPYRVDEAGMHARFRHVDDSGISYVLYGPRRDAVDMAALYGFVCREADFAVSAPLVIDLADYGQLAVSRSTLRRVPPTWTSTDSELATSYLLLAEDLRSTNEFLEQVCEFVTDRGADDHEAVDLAWSSLSTVVDLNRQACRTVHESAAASSHLGARVLQAALDRQGDVLEGVATQLAVTRS